MLGKVRVRSGANVLGANVLHSAAAAAAAAATAATAAAAAGIAFISI